MISRGHRPEESAPAWSPDGRQIAFIQCPDSNAGHFCKLMSMRPDGGGRRTLARNIEWDAQPVWSPDGRRLAFTQSFGPKEQTQARLVKSRYGIYVLGRNGSGFRRVAVTRPTTWGLTNPAWSSDSERVAFSSARGISSVNVRRVKTRRITAKAVGTVSWAPGRRILFADGGAIYVVAPGSSPRRVGR